MTLASVTKLERAWLSVLALVRDVTEKKHRAGTERKTEKKHRAWTERKTEKERKKPQTHQGR